MRILFLCPHGAAKSVVAAAIVADHASREGAGIEVRNAGTDPDEEVNPAALRTLKELGLPRPGKPRLVTAEDIDWADVVVSLGCTLETLPVQPRDWEDWGEAPDVTKDPEGVIDFVQARVINLLT